MSEIPVRERDAEMTLATAEMFHKYYGYDFIFEDGRLVRIEKEDGNDE